MKRTFLTISSVFLLLLATAFVPSQLEQNTDTDPSVFKLMEVTYLWNLLSEGYNPDRESDHTWLNVGFRYKYAIAKKYASLQLLESTFGTPVFQRGPHGEDMDFNSPTSFGYYNPEFISRLRSSIEYALQNPLFKKAVQKVYTQHLQSMAKTYHDAYKHVHKDANALKKLQHQYLLAMASPEGTLDGAFQEHFRGYAEALERDQNADVYEAFTAPAFWLRRSIDGTGPQLFDLVDFVIKEMEEGKK